MKPIGLYTAPLSGNIGGVEFDCEHVITRADNPQRISEGFESMSNLETLHIWTLDFGLK